MSGAVVRGAIEGTEKSNLSPLELNRALPSSLRILLRICHALVGAKRRLRRDALRNQDSKS